MPTASCNGIDTYYEVAGDGVPALFIHGGVAGPEPAFYAQTAEPGGPVRLTTPEEAVDQLAGEAVQVVRHHRRGHGLSTQPHQPYGLEDLADDARALLATLGIERSLVIGHSLGGMVALQYALDFPQHVSALCLVSTGPDLLASATAERGGRLARFFGNVRGDVERAEREGGEAVFESRKTDLRRTKEQAPAGLAAWLAGLSEEDLYAYFMGLLRDCGAFLGRDLSARLHELRVPVTIIHGGADRWVPLEYGRALREGIAQASLHEIDGAGHGNVLSRPGGARALREWVLAGRSRERASVRAA